MKYKMLEGSQVEALEQKVNEYLAEGWKLHGEPFMALHRICQAITKGEYVRPNRVQAKEEKRNAAK